MYTYCSWKAVEERETPSRVIYSVFRSHGTCGIAGAGVDGPEDVPNIMFVYVPDDEVGSPKRNSSLGSSLGRLSGSGFRTVVVSLIQVFEMIKSEVSIEHAKNMRINHERVRESSAPSSHKHSHWPRSSGIPQSASTIIGRGVSFARSFMNSGRA